MGIYLTLFLILFASNYILKRVHNGKKIFLIIMLCSLFLVSSLRAEHIGADHKVYVGMYYGIRRYRFGRVYLTEPLYVLLNILANFVTDSYVGLSFAVNIIIFSALYLFINRYVQDKYKFIIIYIFMLNPYMYIQSTFNVLRQGCAMGVLLFAVPYLLDKKWVKYIITVLIAAQFHNISYVFLLLIFVRLFPWNRKWIGILLAVSSILNLVMHDTRFLSILTNLFGYEGYLTSRESLLNFKFYVFVIFIVVIFFLIYYDRLFNNEKEKAMIDLYFVALSLLPVFVMNAVAYRVYVALAYMSLPAIPRILEAFRLKTQKKEYFYVSAGYYMYYLVFALMFFSRMIATRNTSYVPFQFFWQA